MNALQVGLAACTVLAIVCSGTEARAGIALVSQSRSISADASSGDLPSSNRQTDSATDFNPFNGSVSATFLDDVDPLEGSVASASQNSTVAPPLFTTGGRLSASNFDAVSNANSLYEVVFDLNQPSFYQLNASVTGEFVNSPPQIEFLLSLRQGADDTGPIVLEKYLDGSNLNEPLSMAGQLPADRYFLQMNAYANPFSISGSISADYSASMAISSTAVPLPSAVWLGLAGLVALGLANRWISSRFVHASL